MADLSPGMLEGLGRDVAARSPTRSAETARRVLADVRAMLSTARERGEVLAVPLVPAGESDDGEARQHLPEPEEATRLHQAAEGD